jgi:hypothetical protein
MKNIQHKAASQDAVGFCTPFVTNHELELFKVIRRFEMALLIASLDSTLLSRHIPSGARISRAGIAWSTHAQRIPRMSIFSSQTPRYLSLGVQAIV